MLKKQVLKVVGETAMRVDPNLTREEKFQVFCRVVDGLAPAGRKTKPMLVKNKPSSTTTGVWSEGFSSHLGFSSI